MGKPVPKSRTERRSLAGEISGLAKSKKPAPISKELVERAILQSENLQDIVRVDPAKLERLQTQLSRTADQATKGVRIQKQQVTDIFVKDQEEEDKLVDLFEDVAILHADDAQIVEKLQKAETVQDVMSQLRPIYTQLAPVLRQYRAGMLPKLLKWVPASQLWLQVLEMTDYENWSPQAMYAITRLFIAGLPEDQAYLYISQILVPACQKDIRKNEKLNIHYFNALIKSKFRVFAFFRAVVFFAVEQNQTSAFVKVVNAVLLKCSFPRTAALPAMMQLLQKEPNQALFAVIGALISKRFSLPDNVLEMTVDFFSKTSKVQQTLVWHDSLLRFARIYAATLPGELQVKLYQSAKENPHEGGITDEILRVIRAAGQSGSGQQGRMVGAAEVVI